MIYLGARNNPDGTAACRNPFDLPTIYSTAITVQSNSASVDTLSNNLVDGQWQNLIGNCNKGNDHIIFSINHLEELGNSKESQQYLKCKHYMDKF